MVESKKKPDAADKPKGPSDPILANRETVESIIVAVILALLFRAFVAEAFVIPTGSMAPTLMGRHVDVWCDECKYHYTGSASIERDSSDDSYTNALVVDSRCPNCGFRKPLEASPATTWLGRSLDPAAWSNENSFSGDRIIVSKFAYELGDPKRWDIIVFKYPERAQQNFIKRLIGLPGETLTISGGNIYVQSRGDEAAQIARKPDDKLLAMLQVVHDADFRSPTLRQAGWPQRWQPHGNDESWKSDEMGTTHTLSAVSQDAFVRYHHFDPSEKDWATIERGDALEVDATWRGRLISDFYSYNCTRSTRRDDPESPSGFRENNSAAFGQYWVDDLGVECEVELAEATGEVVLDLVRGGGHYVCRIDAKTGKATLTAKAGDGAVLLKGIEAQTSLTGPGTYRLRMTNVDHELRLWVNGWRVTFDAGTNYESEPQIMPDIQSLDGDLAPVGVGGNNQALTLRHLRVLRDKYYIACKLPDGKNYIESEYEYEPTADTISDLLTHPENPQFAELLLSRREQVFEVGKDQFLPLGDNSPASSDARYWQTHYVDRRLLVGRAIFIYWPHSWNMPPFFPNFRKMQPIR
jgi:signal peptidase I